MIPFLLKFGANHWNWVIPQAFFYGSTRMIFATVTALLMTLFLAPSFIRYLFFFKTGKESRLGDCPVLGRIYEKKQETPAMGGLLISFVMIVSVILWTSGAFASVLILSGGTLALTFLGFIDDRHKMKNNQVIGLRSRNKFLFQLIIGLLISIAVLFVLKDQYRIYFLPFKKTPIFFLKGWWILFGICITIFVIVGSSNGVNLTDGLDGLAAGSIVLVAFVLAIFAFISSNQEVTNYLNMIYLPGAAEVGVYLAAMVGSCLGFLWYNGQPAQIFMGDSGSLALGGGLGMAAILLRREFLLAVVGGIFVIETLSVILQVGSYKLRNKKRIFLCAPLHHHFQKKGWAEQKIVTRFWIFGIVLALIGLISIKIQ